MLFDDTQVISALQVVRTYIHSIWQYRKQAHLPSGQIFVCMSFAVSKEGVTQFLVFSFTVHFTQQPMLLGTTHTPSQHVTVRDMHVPCGMERTLAQSSIASNAHTSAVEGYFITELTHFTAPSGGRQLVQSDSTQKRWLNVLDTWGIQHAHHMNPPATILSNVQSNR